jgi:hypothetical protein
MLFFIIGRVKKRIRRDRRRATNFCTLLEVCIFFKLLLLLRISTSAAVDARGFMTSHGLPEVQKSARILIKDYIKVACCLLLRLYFHFPPSCLGKTSLLPPAAGRSQRSV